ncbi:MAG TPA: pyridine nucleotide-disulfide oxidoreductase [Proteobacteria bacterium]|nr:pyridine nucleotide-disulfide oxidoreductase [Pseudomonadota bacterium]
MKKTDVAIVGGSAAGLMAAVTLKKRHPEKEVAVIRDVTKTPVPCGIPYIYGTLGAVDKDIIPDNKFLEMGIEIIQQKVVDINRKQKNIIFSNDNTLTYDKLILGTGSKPMVPPMPGVDLGNVFTISKDPIALQQLYTALEAAKKVIVIGGGFIGVEMAEQIAKMGNNADNSIDVTIVEMLPHCLMLACEEEFCLQAEDELRQMGINLLTNSQVKALEGDGKVSSVKLADGKSLPTDLVIIGIGAIANIDLAVKMGLDADPRGGITVNEFMQTSDPDIYAAGDCASKFSLITGKPSGIRLASVACTEGMIAASNIYQTTRKTMGALGAFATKIGNRSIAAAGLTTSAATREEIEVIVGEATTPNRHPGGLPGCVMDMKLKLLFRKDTGVVVGGHVSGSESAADMVNIIAVAIQAGLNAEQLATMQYATHPLLTASPLSYHVMLAAENAALQLG